MIVRVAPRRLKEAVKAVLSIVMPRFRSGNSYDPAYHWGPARLYVGNRHAHAWIVLPRGAFRFGSDRRGRWDARWYSVSALESLLPPDLAALAIRLDPYVWQCFIELERDSEDSIPRWPLFPPVYDRLIECDASDPSRLAFYLRHDFGGYFHFLAEIVPVVADAATQKPVYVTVSNEVAARYPFVFPILAQAGLPAECGPGNPSAPEDFRRWIPTSRQKYYYPNRASVSRLRATLAPSGVSLGPPRRLLVERGPSAAGRFLENGEATARELEQKGFQRVVLEDLPFREQLQLFSEAELVVGVHGAGLTNIAFMKRGTCVVEIMPRTEVKWHMAVLARILGVRYRALLAETRTSADGRPGLVRVSVSDLVETVSAELTVSEIVHRNPPKGDARTGSARKGTKREPAL